MRPIVIAAKQRSALVYLLWISLHTPCYHAVLSMLPRRRALKAIRPNRSVQIPCILSRLRTTGPKKPRIVVERCTRLLTSDMSQVYQIRRPLSDAPQRNVVVLDVMLQFAGSASQPPCFPSSLRHPSSPRIRPACSLKSRISAENQINTAWIGNKMSWAKKDA